MCCSLFGVGGLQSELRASVVECDLNQAPHRAGEPALVLLENTMM